MRKGRSRPNKSNVFNHKPADANAPAKKCNGTNAAGAAGRSILRHLTIELFLRVGSRANGKLPVTESHFDAALLNPPWQRDHAVLFTAGTSVGILRLE